MPLLMNATDWKWYKRRIEVDNKCEFQHGPWKPSHYPCRVRSTPTDVTVDTWANQEPVRVCNHEFHYWKATKCESCGNCSFAWQTPLFPEI